MRNIILTIVAWAAVGPTSLYGAPEATDPGGPTDRTQDRVAGDEGRTASTESLLRAANEHYYSGQFATSLGELTDALSQVDMSLRDRQVALLQRAFCYTAQGAVEDARRAVIQAWRVKNDLLVDPDRVPPGFMSIYYDAMTELGVGPRSATLAVLDFENHSGSFETPTGDLRVGTDPLGAGVADMLLSSLHGGPNITIVEREQLDYVQRELGIGDSEAVSDSTRLRIAQLMGARYLLLGGFTRLGDQLQVNARIVLTERAEIVTTQSVRGNVRDALKLIDRLAEKIADALGDSLDTTNHGEVGLDALMRYAEGLELMDGGEYVAAADRFRAAVETAPGFARAEMRLEQLTPVVLAENRDNRR